MDVRTKRKNWLKRPSALFLSSLLVASSFLGVLGPGKEVEAADSAMVGPGGVSDGLKLWTTPDKGITSNDGEKVAEWQDFSSSNNHASQVNEAEMPTFTDSAENNTNFNPMVKFDGANSYLKLDAVSELPTGKQPRSVFGVAKPDKVDADRFFLSWGSMKGSSTKGDHMGVGLDTVNGIIHGSNGPNKGQGTDYLYSDTPSVWQIGKVNDFSFTWTGDNPIGQPIGYSKLKQLNLASNILPTWDTASDTSASASIGRGANGKFNWAGDIGDLIVYDRVLNEKEIQQVNSYLALKYGYTLDQSTPTSYLDSDGDVFWDGTDNEDYNKRITAIGKDAKSGLEQKQAKSQEDDANVAIALGNTIKETNSENTNTITTDKSFFTFSDNGEGVTFATPLSKEKESLKHLERIYKVDKTNWTNTDITLQVDEGTTESAKYLVVSKDATFDGGDTFYLLDDGEVTINSDKLADGVYFTFAAPTNPAIKTSEGNTSYKASTVIVDSELTLDGDVLADYEDDFNGATVTVDNFKTGDVLEFEETDKFTAAYNATNGVLTLTTKDGQTATVDEYEEALQSVTFSTTADNSEDRNITFALGRAVGFGNNGHFYDFISSKGLTWHEAKAKAETKSYFGRQGYLATITSEEENRFITDKTSAIGWIGAADIDRINYDNPGEDNGVQDGDWRWVTGPEGLADDGKGTAFFKGYGLSGIAVDGRYVNWQSGEPNNSKGEWVAHIHENGEWNDFKPTQNTVGGYVIEYGGMPNDATFAISDTKTIVFVKPIVILTEPEANTVKTDKPTFKGTATPGSTVKVKISEDITLTTTADANGNWSVTPDTALSDGEYNIEVTAEKDGVTSEKDTRTLTISTVDKTQLEARDDMSKDLDEDNYDQTSWTFYQEALDKARNVLNDPNATQQQVDEAYNALKKAQDELVPTETGVDKSKLGNKAVEADDLDEKHYTSDSWKNYADALVDALDVLYNEEATQQEVDQALEDLIIAQEALEKKGGLSELTPSTGKLSPSFSNDVYNYSMNVGNGTSEMDFSYGLFDENAKVTMTANGVLVTDGKAPLKVGQNTIVIKVEDATGTKTYTITVNRAKATGGGGTPPPTGPTSDTIIVDLEVDGDNPIEKTPIEITRTTETNGQITDRVELSLKQVQQAVDKALEIGNDTARIVLPDVKDEVDQATVEVPAQAVKLFKENGINLEIYSNDALVTLPETSMEGIEDDFYFRLIPVKKKTEQQEIEERAKLEEVVKALMGSEDINIVARPMTIETNLSSRPVLVTLPLRDVKLPEDEAKREAFLKRLGVYIEHSDGEKEVVFGKVVDMPKGELGLQISVSKFSTFTILNFGEDVQTEGSHALYIHGYEDGTFKPEKSITRNEVALMLARNLGFVDGETEVTTAPFKDVPVGSYGAGAIALLKEMNIFDGYNGNFRGTDNITRAEMAKVVASYMKLEPKKVPVTFKDTENLWSTYYIEAIRDAGIIAGYEDGTFKPQNNLTRAEAVRMFNRMFDRGPLNGITENPFPDVSSDHWAFGEILEAATTHKFTIDQDGKEWFVK